MRSRRRVRAIVFAGTGGREVMRLEQRPDPVPGSEELLVAARFAGVNTADLAQRAEAYPAPPGAPRDVPGPKSRGRVARGGQRCVTSPRATASSGSLVVAVLATPLW